MNVGRYMQRDAVSVLSGSSLRKVKEVMEEHGFGFLLVTDDAGALKGFITKASLAATTDWDKSVADVCFPARFAVSPDDTLEKAALIALANRLVVLPVVDAERLVGVITQSEILRGLAGALGIGLEGTRLSVKVRQSSRDLYRVLDVLGKKNVDLVSLVIKREGDGYSEAIIRIQGIADKEGLCVELEAALGSER